MKRTILPLLLFVACAAGQMAAETVPDDAKSVLSLSWTLSPNDALHVLRLLITSTDFESGPQVPRNQINPRVVGILTDIWPVPFRPAARSFLGEAIRNPSFRGWLISTGSSLAPPACTPGLNLTHAECIETLADLTIGCIYESATVNSGPGYLGQVHRVYLNPADENHAFLLLLEAANTLDATCKFPISSPANSTLAINRQAIAVLCAAHDLTDQGWSISALVDRRINGGN